MKNLLKKIILISAITTGLSFGLGTTVFAQWDTTSGGNYTGGWDTTSGGNYSGGWDTTSGGNYIGGWDTTSGGNYTGGWDTTSGGNYSGGWDTTSVIGTSYTSVPSTYSSYIAPTYSSSNYSGGFSYPSVGYVGSSYVSGYTYPSYTNINTTSYTPPVITTPTYTAPTYTVPTITYPSYTYTAPTISYQTCWNGSVIPNYSNCPSQYKVCANGTSVFINQTCYYGNNYVAPYIIPQVVKFNNVVTSVVTGITNTSARCNGIGLIANNVQSTAWFEYGETVNLGRSTTASSIGSSATSPFSNLLTNLKPTTTYYCRAVMQNQYGIVKGEIVGFTTKSKVTTYVKPVVVTKKAVTKTVVKTKEIICSDGSSIYVKDNTSASIINQGQKLVTVNMEKLEGSLSSNEKVSYRLSYKNISDTYLTNTLIKIAIPQEISFISSSGGSYDENTHTLVLNQYTMNPYSEGVITWTGKVSKNAQVGKSIVTTAYVLYTVPSTSVQDEVTAYVVGSITSQSDSFNSGDRSVIGQGDRSFLPNSLVEWLALIAILFIIFILGRSIYSSYSEDKNNSH